MLVLFDCSEMFGCVLETAGYGKPIVYRLSRVVFLADPYKCIARSKFAIPCGLEVIPPVPVN